MRGVNINRLIKLRKILIFHDLLLFLEIKNITIENSNIILLFVIKTSKISPPYQLEGYNR